MKAATAATITTTATMTTVGESLNRFWPGATVVLIESGAPVTRARGRGIGAFHCKLISLFSLCGTELSRLFSQRFPGSTRPGTSDRGDVPLTIPATLDLVHRHSGTP